MNIDNKEYDYIPMEFSNVVREVDKGDVTGVKFHTHEHSRPLVHALAVRKPGWVFVNRGGTGFIVYEDKEQIGTIGIAGHIGGNPYELGSRTIKKLKRRGHGGVRTKDLKKAIKLALEHFKAKSKTEKLQEIVTCISIGVDRIESQKRAAFQEIRDRVYKHIDRFVVANWDAVEKEVLAAGIKPGVALRFMPQKEEHTSARNVWKAKEAKTGWYVHIEGNVYNIGKVGDGLENYLRLSQDQLPAVIREQVGLLKLLPDDNTLIDGVGHRYDATSFYIMEKKE